MYNKLADGSWEFIGRSARNSDVRTTSTGKDMVTFSIMYHKDEKTNEAKYMNFCVFSPFVEKAKTITKGSIVHAYGRLDQSEYTNKDGETKKSNRIFVDWLDVQNKTYATAQNSNDDYVPYDNAKPAPAVSRGTTANAPQNPSTSTGTNSINVDYSDFDGDIFI